jgi:hypothetical protein
MSAFSPSPPRPPERPAAGPREHGTHATRGAPGGSGAAFILGLPLAAALLALLHFGPLRHTPAHRYVTHPIENVEIVVFCCALGVLASKAWGSRAQRQALAARILPTWDGQPLPPSKAPALLAEVSRLPASLRNTWVVRRTAAILDFVCSRRTAASQDDEMHYLSDSDAMALENSFSLINFLIWSLPILGFLGTVLGIAEAVTNVTPEVLENSISSVTGGLALAFDTTGLALGLTLSVMFLKFLTDRREQAVLEEVDRFCEVHLKHRFARAGADSGPFVSAVQQNSEVLLKATEQLVRRQADVWAQALAATEAQRRQAEQQSQEQLTSALAIALDRTLTSHQQRLAALERQTQGQTTEVMGALATLAERVGAQQAALVPVANGMQVLGRALAGIKEGEGQLLALQQTLVQNLAVLSASGSFEEAVHSLTAAIHLLTARAAGTARLRGAA